MSNGRDEVKDERLVTPAMLTSYSLTTHSSSAVCGCAAPTRQLNLTDSTNPHQNKVDECTMKSNLQPIKRNNGFTGGLTKEQLREAVVHLIQNDTKNQPTAAILLKLLFNDFLNRPSNSYKSRKQFSTIASTS